MRHRSLINIKVHRIGRAQALKLVGTKTKHHAAKQTRLRRIIGHAVGTIFGTSFVALLLCAVVFFGYLAFINNSLPSTDKIALETLDQSTRIYDRNGTLLYTIYGKENREYVSLDKISSKAQMALLAAEDIEFYNHKGIDVTNIFSALLDGLQGKPLRGASTITQQLSRNVVLEKIFGRAAAQDRSLERKLTEMVVAIQLEKKLSKDQILEIQMNEVFFGGTIYGYQTAARAYFSKDAKDLTLAESAYLAGIIQAPAFYQDELSKGNVALLVKRRNDILDLMLKHKDTTKVTGEEILSAKAEPLNLKTGQLNLTAPHFVFYVIDQLKKQYGEEFLNTGGLRVKTTLDLPTQRVAERKLGDNIANFRTWYGVNNGAVVVISPKNGEVLAMVGSADYTNTSDKRVDGNVNVAVMPRQMGSSVKPYTYAAAFRDGYNPGSVVPDIAMKFGNYKPTDWDNRFQGVMSIRSALNKSRNAPAVYTLQTIGGPSRFIQEAKVLGITTLGNPSNYGLSITLGAGEMTLLEHTNAFGAWANRGVKYDPSVILEIKDTKNKTLFSLDPPKSEKRVYSEQESYLMNWILCQMGGRMDKGAAWMYEASGQKLCGKTGTSTGPKDLITIGYYPKLLVGVWTGNNNGALTFGTRGQGWSENVPIVIMRDIMRDLVPMYGKEFYSQPSGVVNGFTCKNTGQIVGKDASCLKEATVYIPSKRVPKFPSLYRFSTK